MISFEFINKSVFFPEQGILAIGDLHIGREEALRQAGFMVPETQVREIIEDLEKIIKGFDIVNSDDLIVSDLASNGARLTLFTEKAVEELEKITSLREDTSRKPLGVRDSENKLKGEEK